MSVDDLKTSELNLYSKDRKLKYQLFDATGLIPGLAPSTPIMKIESTISVDGNQGSVAIPNLLYQVQGTQYYGFLSYKLFSLENEDQALGVRITSEANERKASDAVLTVALQAEETERKQNVASIQTALASETLTRTLDDQKNASDIAFESSQRAAAVSSLTNMLYATNASVSDEKLRAEAAELALSTAISTEIARAVSRDDLATAAIAAEQARATDVENKLDTDLKIEKSRALMAEADLLDKVNFITANTDSKALDSIQELLTAFSGADNSFIATVAALTARVADLEETVAYLRGTHV